MRRALPLLLALAAGAGGRSGAGARGQPERLLRRRRRALSGAGHRPPAGGDPGTRGDHGAPAGRPQGRPGHACSRCSSGRASRAAPPPDAAVPVPGAPDTWSAQLWLMAAASYSVRVTIEGPRGPGGGPGAGARRAEPGARDGQGLGVHPAGARGCSCSPGRSPIVGAAVREASLPPGEAVDGRRRARARVVAVPRGPPLRARPLGRQGLVGPRGRARRGRGSSSRSACGPRCSLDGGRPRARPGDRRRRGTPGLVAADPGPRQADAPVPDPRARPRRLRPPPSGGPGEQDDFLRRPPAAAGGHLPRSTPTSSTRAASRRPWWTG